MYAWRQFKCGRMSYSNNHVNCISNPLQPLSYWASWAQACHHVSHPHLRVMTENSQWGHFDTVVVTPAHQQRSDHAISSPHWHAAHHMNWCLNGSLLHQLCCTIYNLFTCTELVQQICLPDSACLMPTLDHNKLPDDPSPMAEMCILFRLLAIFIRWHYKTFNYWLHGMLYEIHSISVVAYLLYPPICTLILNCSMCHTQL